jgi:hypothetical protein
MTGFWTLFIELTDEYPASSDGRVMLVHRRRDGTRDPVAYGPDDVVEIEGKFQTAAFHVLEGRGWSHRAGEVGWELAKRFLAQWPGGPQLEAV